MGQYYVIANMSKKEFLHPHRYDNGMKLMEFSYQRNPLINTVLNLLKNEWKGNRVYVIGDYADLKIYNQEDYCWHDTLADLVKEFGVHDGDYEKHPDTYSMQAVIEHTFHHVNETDERAASTTARYLYNHATKQVIDLATCKEDEWGYTVAPISLLLAMGNERGGGDYHKSRPGFEYVGAWVSTSRYIEVTDEPLPGCESYEKFNPGFMEG